MLEKTQQTAIGAAFGRHGVTPARAELMIALAKFRNNGGTYAEVISCVRSAYADELPGKGLAATASNGQSLSAQPRQPNEDEAGHSQGAGNGRSASAPSPSPDRGGNGQLTDSRKGHATSVPLARDPTPSQRAATEKVKDASARIAMTVLESTKTADGKPWGGVKAHELNGMYRDGTVARAVYEYLGPLSPRQRYMTLRELMTGDQFKDVLARVRGKNNAA